MKKWITGLWLLAMCVIFISGMGMDCYAQDKQTYTVKQSGFSVEELQKILNTASDTQEVEVFFEKGTYEVTQCIYLRSNTTIHAQGATFVRSGAALMNGSNLLSNNAEGQTGTNRGSGYSLTKNITIIGGTFDGGDVAKAKIRANLVIFGHADGIRIQNATFKNCYGSHLIELAGVKNCVIDGCTFDGSGFRYNDAHDESEAVQIDICAEGLNGSFGADKTPCDGITVQNSIIKNYPRAVGNHNTVSGARNKNIKIIGNQISSTKFKDKQAILFYCFDNSEAKNNTISGYATAVQVFNSTGIAIDGNTIAGGSSNGISVLNNSKITSIAGNTITKSALNAISVKGGANVQTIMGNNLVEAGNNAILIAEKGTTVSAIEKNQITAPKQNGISLNENCTVSRVNDNVLKGVGGNAIRVAVSVKLVKGNTITNAKANGIDLSNQGAKVAEVSLNKISNTKGRAAVNVSCGSIEKLIQNTITSSAQVGIKVTTKQAKIGTIEDNTVSGSGTSSLALSAQGKADTVTGNIFEASKTHNIAVTGKSVVDEIENNQILDSGKSAVYVSNAGSIIKTLRSNTITQTKSHAICVASKGSIKTVKENTISDVKGYGLSVVSGSKTTLVQKNEFSKCKNHAVYFGKASIKTKVDGNRFMNNKKAAIYIGKGVKATIKSNVISGYAEKEVQIVENTDKSLLHQLKSDKLTVKSTKVSGTAGRQANITVKIGKQKYQKRAGTNGKFAVTIPKQKKKTKVTIQAVDKYKNSISKTIVVS